MAKRIRPREREAILTALSGGVTPRRGIQHIQVGRAEEIKSIIADIESISQGDASCRIVSGPYGAGKTFFMQLCADMAVHKNLLVMNADLSPDRRLYASTQDGSNKALNLYQALVRSIASTTRPNGGPEVLSDLLDSAAAKISSADTSVRADLQRLPYGFDAFKIVTEWQRANEDLAMICTEKMSRDDLKAKRKVEDIKDSCLRWFNADIPLKTARDQLGVTGVITGDKSYDALKVIAALAVIGGFAGLFVELDEFVNIWKINNTQSRDRNYEVVLRILNESLQGDSHNIGFLIAATPQAIFDDRRGMASYEALASRLQSQQVPGASQQTGIGPVIQLSPLSQEDLLVLLGNITNVDALGDKDAWKASNSDMEAFLKRFHDKLGADYYRTPREVIREWVAVLLAVGADPKLEISQAIGEAEINADQEGSVPQAPQRERNIAQGAGVTSKAPGASRFGF